MSFFRSEEMSLCQMMLHQENAFEILRELGNEGKVHFINLNEEVNISSLKYSHQVQLCFNFRKAIDKMWADIEETNDIKIVYYPDIENLQVKVQDLRDIDLEITTLEEQLRDAQNSRTLLGALYSTTLERYYVLANADTFLQGHQHSPIMAWTDSIMKLLIQDDFETGLVMEHHSKLSFYAGTIACNRLYGFERIIFRITQGNYFLRTSEIPEPVQEGPILSPVMVRKFSFILFFMGNTLREKLLQVCKGYGCNLYDCPESHTRRMEDKDLLEIDLNELRRVLRESEEHKHRILQLAATELHIWRVKVQKMLNIYVTLNKLCPISGIKDQKYLVGECWIPSNDVQTVQKACERGARIPVGGGDTILDHPPFISEKPIWSSKRKPPTLFRVNKYTQVFQHLVDAYGTAAYGELNPAPYSIVTFPFLFGIMFGDVGHGFLLFLFGIYMVCKEKEILQKQRSAAKSNEIWELTFSGRYLIVLMGLFSMYAGFVYNVWFSKPMNIFGSAWKIHHKQSTVRDVKFIQLNPTNTNQYRGHPYVYGLDPIWGGNISENSLVLQNSIKMKLSIIFGVMQMMIGLMLGGVNLVTAGLNVDLWLNWVPQVLFMLCVFVHMVFLIFMKWQAYGGNDPGTRPSQCAPSILITTVDMYLMKGRENVEGCKSEIYDGQIAFQYILLTISMACIPILFFGKPLISLTQDLNSNKHPLQASSSFSMQSISTGDSKTELWIQQGIHAIESILGAVSHTASYLRLWALSLAHDQLSAVLWNMVLMKPVAFLSTSDYWTTGITMSLSFALWAILTLGILIIMEGLSAFLHTLRLHWVEFQSKFYEGTGEPFTPFAFGREERKG